MRPRLISFQQHDDELHLKFQRCRVGDIVDVVNESRDAATLVGTRSIDILFAYTAHGELARWIPFIKAGGLVILHGDSGVEALRSNGFDDAWAVGSLSWAIKHCASSQTEAQEQSIDTMLDFVRRSAREIAEARHAIEALHRSWSWKLTAPLRLAIETVQAIAGVFASLSRGSAGDRISGLSQWLRYRGEVRASGLFDSRYYRDRHPGIAWARTSPLLHFFVDGAACGHNPNELFDLRYYLARYPDVADSALNPLIEYLKSGAYQGRDPHPYFSSSFYLDQNPDVREARLNPLAHYLGPGIVEGRDPNPWFDTSEYLEQNPDVATFGLNPLVHQTESRPPDFGLSRR
jgi:hypothetical protein